MSVGTCVRHPAAPNFQRIYFKVIQMFRLTSLIVFGAALALPGFAVADCGCAADPCDACAPCVECATVCNDPCCCQPQTRTRLKLVRVCKEVCRTQRVCTTDACGCPTTARVRVVKNVSRLRLARVEVPARHRCCADTGCSTCQAVQDCGCH